MHVATANRNAFFHRVDHEIVEYPARVLDVWQPWVSPVLTLDERQELSEPLAKYIKLIQVSLHMKLKVTVFRNPSLAVWKTARIELDVLHCIYRSHNFGHMVH